MANDLNRQFRDHVTRVSFNLSLTRNQISAFRDIVFWIENGPQFSPANKDVRSPRSVEKDEARAAGQHYVDAYIVGLRFLLSHGLIVEHPEWLAEDRRIEAAKKKGERWVNRKWAIQRYEITPAGQHVLALLRIAGLMPQSLKLANENRPAAKPKKRRGR